MDATRSNFLIALAPYFLPIYALLMLLLVSGLRFVCDMSALDPLSHFAIGAAYSFHITLTLHALSAKQTDISDNGALLSSIVIVAGNAAVLLLCIPLLTGQVGMTTALVWWGNDSLRFVSRFAGWLAAGIPPVFGLCQNSLLK